MKKNGNWRQISQGQVTSGWGSKFWVKCKSKALLGKYPNIIKITQKMGQLKEHLGTYWTMKPKKE